MPDPQASGDLVPPLLTVSYYYNVRTSQPLTQVAWHTTDTKVSQQATPTRL